MINIQRRKGKNKTSFRVEMMHDGKRVSKSFKTRVEADRFVAKITLNPILFDDLSNSVLNTTTLREMVDIFFTSYSARDNNIRGRLQKWCDWLGDMKLYKITKRHVKAELRRLDAAGKAPATINRYKSSLSAVFAFICDKYDTNYNPCKSIKQCKEDNARSRFLSREEIELLLISCKTSSWPRLYLLVLMALTTGARRSEMINLRWSDINFKKHLALVKKTKNGSPKVLVFTDDVMNELKSIRKLGHGYVYSHPTVADAYFKHFDSYWQSAREASGVKDFRFHDLRHTAASMLAMNGASLLEIADVLGHKSLTMTQRYSHLCTEHKSRLINRVMGGIE